MLVRAARCPSWCDTAPPARGNLLLALGSFNSHNHLEGGAYVEVCVGRAACWFVRRIVRRGATRRLRRERTSYSLSARLIFINILKGGHRSKCVLVVQRAGSCGALSVMV